MFDTHGVRFQKNYVHEVRLLQAKKSACRAPIPVRSDLLRAMAATSPGRSQSAREGLEGPNGTGVRQSGKISLAIAIPSDHLIGAEGKLGKRHVWIG